MRIDPDIPSVRAGVKQFQVALDYAALEVPDNSRTHCKTSLNLNMHSFDKSPDNPDRKQGVQV